MEIRARGLISLPTEPGIFSDAAWYIVAGIIAQNGDVRIPNVCVHPAQTALLKYLILMGAPLRMENHRWESNDPVVDFHSLPPKKLLPVRVYPEDMPHLVQDLPALMICAACADGTSFIPDTPDAQAIAQVLIELGVTVEREPDTLKIIGQRYFSALCFARASSTDPRMAKLLALAKLRQKDAKHV